MKTAHFTLVALLLAVSTAVCPRARAETLITTVNRTESDRYFGETLPIRLFVSKNGGEGLGGQTIFEDLADPDFEYIRTGPFLDPTDYTFAANLLGPVRLTSGSLFEAMAADFQREFPSASPTELELEIVNDFNYAPLRLGYPPNFYSLFGTGLHLSAIEAELTLLEPVPHFSGGVINQMHWNVSFDVRFFAVPEPSSFMLLVASCLCLPRRVFRR